MKNTYMLHKSQNIMNLNEFFVNQFIGRTNENRIKMKIP